MTNNVEELGKGLMTNYINLFRGRLISHLIGAIGSILIIRILEPEDFGILSIAMSIPYIVGAFGNLGVNTAVTHFTSKHKASNLDYAKKVIASGMVFDVLFGSALALAGYLLSPFIFSLVLNKPSITPYGEFASIYTVIYWSFSSTFSGLLGLELTHYNSRLWIIHYSFQTLSTVALAIAWSKIYGVILGYALSYLVVVIYGALILRRQGILKGVSPSLTVLIEMLRYSLPLTLSSAINNVFGIYTNSFVNRVLTIIIISNLNASSRISFFFDTIFNPLSYAIQPLLSKMDKTDKLGMNVMINKLFKLRLMLQVPLILIIFSLSTIVINVLAGPQYESASFLLKLSMIGYLITSASGGSILNSLLIYQGYTKFSMRIGILNTLIYAILVTGLVIKFGVIGYFIAGWFYWIPGYAITMMFVTETFSYKFPARLVFEIFVIGGSVMFPLIFIDSLFGIPIAIGLLLLVFKLYVRFGLLTKGEIEVFVHSLRNSGLGFLEKPLLKLLS
ncbi:hypothetical protein HS7_15270 [Sulfolobales archaeon HS-7]|nr:hypothetical protein HS7_15270 [Sulfolobales archaeon HS-7]